MVNPLIVDPDPEPDIEGDIRNNSQSHQQTTQSQSTAASAAPSPPQAQQPVTYDPTKANPFPLAPKHVFNNEKDYAFNDNHDAAGDVAIQPVDSAPSSTAIAAPTLNPSGQATGTNYNANAIDENLHRSPSQPIGGDEQDVEPTDDGEFKSANITWGMCFKNTIKGCPILLGAPVLLPIAWAMHGTHQNPVAVFVTCLLGIVPLAAGLGFATEELALRLGEAWGGLLNATFGNAIELLIAILAMVKGEIDLVQASMIGSILSNILLVLGMSYFAGGLRFHEQLYAIIGAQMHISLLGLSIAAIVLPAAFHYAYPSTSAIIQEVRSANAAPDGDELRDLLAMSRGLSFLLLAAYGMFLTFQLYTHAYLFRIPREPQVHPLPGPAPATGRVFPRPHWVPSIGSSSTDSAGEGSSRSGNHNGPLRRLRRWSVRSRDSNSNDRTEELTVPSMPSPIVSPAIEPLPIPEAPAQPYVLDLERQAKLPPHVRFVGASADPSAMEAQPIEPVRCKREEPQVKTVYAFGMLLAMTGLAGITAEFLIDSIDGLTENTSISREFVGLILLPVIGNSVEHITAVTVSVKDKLNLSMSIAVGSSIQVSLCLLPILVLLGWAIGQPMMLFFDTFETITLVIAVLVVNFAIADGRTNYLEGFCMMMVYLAIALVTFYYDPAH